MKRVLILLGVLVFGLSFSVNATIIDRGNGLIYDDDLDITWLADANYAMTSGFDGDGRMSWSTASNWVSSLTYGGYDDWRLPSVPTYDPDCYRQDGNVSWGYNCINSEMGHLYYVELGNLAYVDINNNVQVGWGLTNTSYFENLQTERYWTGGYTVGNQFNTDLVFNFNGGLQNFSQSEWYVLVVRDGDVSSEGSNGNPSPPNPQPVPEPSTIALLSIGMVGLLGGAVRRKLKRKGAQK